MKVKCSPVSGYIPNNPNNTILDFEKELLSYMSETPEEFQCVITDSCTNAFKACLFYNEFVSGEDFYYYLPDRTYVSMYHSLMETVPNFKVELKDINWSNTYKVANIVDSAAYLPKGTINELFTDDIDFVLLSFGNKKPLANDRGGCIIFKRDFNKYNFLKRYTHNGRDSAIPVRDDKLLFVEYKGFVGGRYNLVPEQVVGLREKLKNNEIKNREASHLDYPSITEIIKESLLQSW